MNYISSPKKLCRLEKIDAIHVWSKPRGFASERKVLPQTPPELTRKGSIVVQIRCPASLKKALKEAASERDCFKDSVNALVRDVIRSRYHRPEIPEPDPNEPAIARLSLRLTFEERDALKSYAEAWRMPLWRAIYLLATRPYTVSDRPSASHVTHAASHFAHAFGHVTHMPHGTIGDHSLPSVTHTPHVTHMSHTKEEDKRFSFNVCPDGNAFKPIEPLAERLWHVYGMALSVANSVVTCYERDAIFAAIELRERRNGAIYNPAGFILYLLKGGYAQRYAEAKRSRIDPDLLARQVAQAVEEQTGVKVTLIEGSPAIAYKNGWLHLPLNPDSAVATVKRLLSQSETDRQSESDIKPDAPKGNQTDAPSEPIDELDNFEVYPFAKPTKLPKIEPRSREERAAEIIADQLKPIGKKAKRTCPRCGKESVELQLKRFERRYRQIHDAETLRWDGVEVCFGDPASCWESLKKSEITMLKEVLSDNLTEPNLTNSAAASDPVSVGSVIAGILPIDFAPKPNSQKRADSESTPNALTETEPEPENPKTLPYTDSHDQHHAHKFVKCPRCGRDVRKSRMGKSGICLNCVQDELLRMNSCRSLTQHLE